MHSRPKCYELTFAGVQTLPPRMIKFRIDNISTVLEPSTTKKTTTKFSTLLADTALCAFR